MKYKCRICGYIHDEEKEGIAVADMTKCPVCQQPIENLLPLSWIFMEKQLLPNRETQWQAYSLQ